MPLLEVLPNSTTTSAPGWAYVPDTGLDPVKAGHVPRNPRKRVAGGAAGGGPGLELSARQQAAQLKRLAELDRDNARDVTIAIPSRAKAPDGGGRAAKGKTPATRRILLAQKTFANYLADEEAWSAQQDAEGAPTTLAAAAAAVATAAAANAASSSSPAPASAPTTARASKQQPGASKRRASGPGKRGKGSSPPVPDPADPSEAPGAPVAPPPPPPPTTPPPPPAAAPAAISPPARNAPPASANPFASADSPASQPVQQQQYVPPPPPPVPPLSPRSEALLRTNTPAPPSAALMHALTHAPPLSFQAARVPAPGASTQIGKPVESRPRRRFCIMCGRWGRTRCAACGEGTCGLDCAKAHAESCVGLGARR